jgi:hypothetical protein
LDLTYEGSSQWHVFAVGQFTFISAIEKLATEQLTWLYYNPDIICRISDSKQYYKPGTIAADQLT